MRFGRRWTARLRRRQSAGRRARWRRRSRALGSRPCTEGNRPLALGPHRRDPAALFWLRRALVARSSPRAGRSRRSASGWPSAADAGLIATTGARTSAWGRGHSGARHPPRPFLAQYVAICVSLVHVLERLEPASGRTRPGPSLGRVGSPSVGASILGSSLPTRPPPGAQFPRRQDHLRRRFRYPKYLDEVPPPRRWSS